METELTPAEKAQMLLVEYAIDLIATNPNDPTIVHVGLIMQYTAAAFMKRPELMYKIFNELETLEGAEEWLDKELDSVERLYEDSH